MSVVQAGTEPDVFVVFENGLAKRTPVSEYRLQGRGGTGIQVAKLSDKGGDLVGALTVTADDEVMVVMEKGKIVRSRVDEVRHTGRSTMGVKFATPDQGDSIVAVARNAESTNGDSDGDTGRDSDADGPDGDGDGEGAARNEATGVDAGASAGPDVTDATGGAVGRSGDDELPSDEHDDSGGSE
jgi:DNA gyrase subunit A